MGNGYIAYQRRNEETGLENQCWKDSWDSISLPRRPAARLPARDLRAAGLRLRREGARRPPRPRGLAATRSSPSELEKRGRRPQAPVQPRLLGRGRRVLRARARRRGQPGRRAHLQHRPPAVERHRRPVQGEGGRRAPDGAARCSPAGACARWPRARAATTRSATTSAPSGRSTTRSSPGACAATASSEEAARIAAGILDAAEYFDGRLPEAFGGYAALADPVPGAVPHRVQPAGLVDRRAAAVAAHDARPGAAGRPPHRRPGAAVRTSAGSSCLTSAVTGGVSTPSAGGWLPPGHARGSSSSWERRRRQAAAAERLRGRHDPGRRDGHGYHRRRHAGR